MNLVIDVGNTTVKLAVFKAQTLQYKTHFSLSALRSEYKIVKKAFPKLKAAIIASVGHLHKSQITEIKNDLRVLELNHSVKLPFINDYETPRTLGVDRLALVSAAALNYPKQNVLVIDAGTCITYDFINAEGHYKGGAISPGLKLRYSALHKLTANLPLLEICKPQDFVGNSTDTSIHSGVVFGTVSEINGIIAAYTERYQDLTVILTGGNSEFLSNQLKNSIFANSNFLLEGLNFILDYNSSQ